MNNQELCKLKLETYREQLLSVYRYCSELDDKEHARQAYAVVFKLLECSIYDIELLNLIKDGFDSILSKYSDIATLESYCSDGQRELFAFVDAFYREDIADNDAYELSLHSMKLFATSRMGDKGHNTIVIYYNLATLCMLLTMFTGFKLRYILKHSPVLTSRLNEIKNDIKIVSTDVKKKEEEEKANAEKRKNERKNTITNSDLSTTTEDSTNTLPASDNSTAQKSKTKATRSKASPIRNASSGKLDDLHPAVRIFKRFVALNGKEYNRAKVERILKALQREIINHTITKDYEYASEVNHLQTKLVEALNFENAGCKQSGKLEIETELLARLQHIIGDAKPADAIALLKSYVRLAGSTDKDKAKRLLKRFDRYNIETPSSALTPHLKSAKNALSDFVAGKSTAIALDEFALHGLNGVWDNEDFRKNIISQIKGTLLSDQWEQLWKNPISLIYCKDGIVFGYRNARLQYYSPSTCAQIFLSKNKGESPFYLTPDFVQKHGGMYDRRKLIHIYYKYDATNVLSKRTEVRRTGTTLICADFVFGLASPKYGKIELTNLESIEYVEKLIDFLNKKHRLPPIYHDETNKNYFISTKHGKGEIHLVDKGQFKTIEDYYAALLHEIVHSTGPHLKRPAFYESGDYTKLNAAEELVAELGSYFICSELRLRFKQNNSIAYLRYWFKKLNDDDLITAYNRATDAVEYLLEGIDLEKLIPQSVKDRVYDLQAMKDSGSLSGILPSEKLQSLTFDTISVEHPFNKLLGQPEIPFRVMIHGAPGSGKTTLGLRIAYSLAANNGLKTLVISSEEGIGYKIQQRLNDLGLYHPNLFVSNSLPSDLAGYQVVLLDSIVSLGLNAEQLRTLYSENPETSFIIINQETKQGNSRGSLELEHDVDTIVRCQDMVATTLKNRFGSLDSMQIR